jgi:hypothetical protein
MILDFESHFDQMQTLVVANSCSFVSHFDKNQMMKLIVLAIARYHWVPILNAVGASHTCYGLIPSCLPEGLTTQNTPTVAFPHAKGF